MVSGQSKFACGGIAQLGERLNGIQEVSGSIPLTSTRKNKEIAGAGYLLFLLMDPVWDHKCSGAPVVAGRCPVGSFVADCQTLGACYRDWNVALNSGAPIMKILYIASLLSALAIMAVTEVLAHRSTRGT